MSSNMSNYEDAQHPRGADGRWVTKTAGAPAASLPEPPAQKMNPRVVDASTLNTDRQAVYDAVDDVIDAEVAQTDSLVRETMKPGQRASLKVRGENLTINEIWDIRTGDVITDTPRRIPVTAKALDSIASRQSMIGVLHKVEFDGPNREQATQAVEQTRQAHAQASMRLIDDALTAIDQHRNARKVELQTQDGRTVGTVAVGGLIVHRADGGEERYGTASDEWDAFAHPIADDLDPRALQALPQDDNGRIDMATWRSRRDRRAKE
ncbi:hypothetical protein GZ998_03535 [Actinomyces sp. 594]|uniref:hypothetical protein n=1 Tax=Actinomyces sp. 594 TaxID=2057793 RepID=UPI001C561EA8|nr:hypothetical protein [Actinomyces sp. 594]MBW3068586.1 hypothetical protein [Actinomyces sp. 594]